MKQVPLQIQPRLRYSVDNYLVHSGVAPIVDGFTSALLEDRFNCFLVKGQPRSGKTHLGLVLSERVHDAGKKVSYRSSADFALMGAEESNPSIERIDCGIVDDADLYFESLFLDKSPEGNTDHSPAGAFVSWYESIRQGGGVVVLFVQSTNFLSSCDSHIASRIRAATEFSIEDVSDAEAKEMLAMLSKQRGLSLSARQIEYIQRRVSPSISGQVQYFDRLLDLSNNSSRAQEAARVGEFDLFKEAFEERALSQ